MADAKVVRLRDSVTGVVVQADEATAALLSGFEPADGKAPAKRSSSKSDK